MNNLLSHLTAPGAGGCCSRGHKSGGSKGVRVCSSVLTNMAQPPVALRGVEYCGASGLRPTTGAPHSRQSSAHPRHVKHTSPVYIHLHRH